MTTPAKKKKKEVALVKKSNDLIESRYKFDIWETRFFLSVLAKIGREDSEFDRYRIKYRDIIKDFGLVSNNAYAMLREGAKKLLKQTVTLKYEKEGYQRGKEMHLIRMIDYLDEKDGTAKNTEQEYIDVTIEEELKPFLLQLSKNFTAYDLKNIAKLGVYSIRLYELLKQYESIGKRTMDVEEMKTMFQLESEYPLFANFYQKVVQPAVTEINKHTDLKIGKPEKIKDGRRVVALTFKISRKLENDVSKAHEPQEGTKTQPEPVKSHIEMAEFIEIVEESGEVVEARERLIAELSATVVIKFGVSLKVFMALAEKYTEGELRNAVKLTEKGLSSGKLTNVAGFFVEALRGHYQDAEVQKQQLETDKALERKAKVAAEKKSEKEAEEQRKRENAAYFERQKTIFAHLLEEDETFWTELEAQIRLDQLLKNHYNFSKNVFENMQIPMIAGSLMAIATKLRKSAFGR